jgi:hypothetical protein
MVFMNMLTMSLLTILVRLYASTYKAIIDGPIGAQHTQASIQLPEKMMDFNHRRDASFFSSAFWSYSCVHPSEEHRTISCSEIP